MNDAELELLLASYCRMCAEAGIEPPPDDEARESAKAMTGVLVPSVEAEFRQH